MSEHVANDGYIGDDLGSVVLAFEEVEVGGLSNPGAAGEGRPRMPVLNPAGHALKHVDKLAVADAEIVTVKAKLGYREGGALCFAIG